MKMDISEQADIANGNSKFKRSVIDLLYLLHYREVADFGCKENTMEIVQTSSDKQKLIDVLNEKLKDAISDDEVEFINGMETDEIVWEEELNKMQLAISRFAGHPHCGEVSDFYQIVEY